MTEGTNRLAEFARRDVEHCFQGKRLDVDGIGQDLVSLALNGAEDAEPLRTYAQMLAERRQGAAQEFLDRSDPTLVTAYDALVAAFNADLKRIRAEQDDDAVTRTYEALKALLA